MTKGKRSRAKRKADRGKRSEVQSDGILAKSPDAVAGSALEVQDGPPQQVENAGQRLGVVDSKSAAVDSTSTEASRGPDVNADAPPISSASGFSIAKVVGEAVAILIAIAAAFFAWDANQKADRAAFEAAEANALTKASNRPDLRLEEITGDEEHEYDLTFQVRNVGGRGTVHVIAIAVDGRFVEDAQELVSRLWKEYLPSPKEDWWAQGIAFENYPIGPGEVVTIVSTRGDGVHNVVDELDRVSQHVCYCAPWGDCWTNAGPISDCKDQPRSFRIVGSRHRDAAKRQGMVK